jgi:hypothetical protein
VKPYIPSSVRKKDDINDMLESRLSMDMGHLQHEEAEKQPNDMIEKMLLPSMTSIENAILVHGFDDDTKEEELIEFYYRLVYGGGTRNIYDGKVKSCQIFSIPLSQHED